MLTLTEINQRRAELADEVRAIDTAVAERKGKTANDAESKRLTEITEEFGRLDEAEPMAKNLDKIRQANVPSGDSANPIKPTKAKLPAEPKKDDDPACGFRDIHDQLKAVMSSTANHQMDNRLKLLNVAGSDEQGEYSGPFGDFLIAPAFLPQLLSVEPEGNPTAGMTMDIPMETKMVSIPARTDKNHSTSVTGGLTVSRRAETQAGTSSRMEFEQVKLVATYLTRVSSQNQELLADSPIAVTALIEQGFRDEFASKIFDEELNGTGNGEFEGILNSPAKIAVAKEGSQAADTILGANILKMRARAWRYGRCVWLANHDCYEQLASAHITGSNGDRFLFEPGPTFLGRRANQWFAAPD
mgnify:FL=1